MTRKITRLQTKCYDKGQRVDNCFINLCCHYEMMLYNNELCERINIESKDKIYILGCSLKNGRFKDLSTFKNRGDLKIRQYLKTRCTKSTGILLETMMDDFLGFVFLIS